MKMNLWRCLPQGILLFAVMYAPFTAEAQQVTGEFGNWMTYVNVLPQSRTRVCGMMYVFGVAEGKGIAKSVTFKIYGKSATYPDGLAAIDIYKESWDLPKGIHPNIAVAVDDSPPVLLESVGHGNDIELRIPTESIAPFLFAIMDGRVFVVKFPSSTEADWTISLYGSRNAVGSLVKCAKTH